MYTIGAFLTLDACRIIWVQYITSNLGTWTWSTLLTKSNTVAKAVTQKITLLIFVLDMPKTNNIVLVLRVWPHVS